MITGGYNYGSLDSTEILDTEGGSVTMASPMNFKRQSHGMGVITINGKDRLVVFGGYYGGKMLDSVEFYNTKTEKWEMADFKLSEPKVGFGFLTVKLGDILSNLQSSSSNGSTSTKCKHDVSSCRSGKRCKVSTTSRASNNSVEFLGKSPVSYETSKRLGHRMTIMAPTNYHVRDGRDRIKPRGTLQYQSVCQ